MRALIAAFLVTVACQRREMPPDPAGMVRAEGEGFSIPVPSGFESARLGAAEIALRNDRVEGEPSAIAALRGDGGSVTASECAGGARKYAEDSGETLTYQRKIDLPPGKTCHFATEQGSGRVRHFYAVETRKGSVLIACGFDPTDEQTPKDCEHVARWIRA